MQKNKNKKRRVLISECMYLNIWENPAIFFLFKYNRKSRTISLKEAVIPAPLHWEEFHISYMLCGGS